MKVFLSWSGKHSQQVAQLFHTWLPDVINEIDPFMSSEIEAGARWQQEISTELESTDFGLIFVTSENQRRPWLNFEAGALAKAVDISRVVPVAIDLDPPEIEQPLGQFQAQRLSTEGIRRIMSAINNSATQPLETERLDRLLSKWWPDLKKEIDDIDTTSVKSHRERSQKEMLEEIVSTVRLLARDQTRTERELSIRERALLRKIRHSSDDSNDDVVRLLEHLATEEAPYVTTQYDKNSGTLRILFEEMPSPRLRNELHSIADKSGISLTVHTAKK